MKNHNPNDWVIEIKSSTMNCIKIIVVYALLLVYPHTFFHESWQWINVFTASWQLVICIIVAFIFSSAKYCAEHPHDWGTAMHEPAKNIVLVVPEKVTQAIVPVLFCIALLAIVYVFYFHFHLSIVDSAACAVVTLMGLSIVAGLVCFRYTRNSGM